MNEAVPQIREVIWPFDDEIKASGLLRVRDYGNALFIRGRSSVRTRFWIIALVPLTIMEILGILIMASVGLNWGSVLFTVFPLAMVYILFINPYLCSWYMIRRHRLAGKPVGTWVFSQQGIRYEDAESEACMKWSLVAQAIVTDRYVLLHLRDGRYHTFAAPMFDIPTDWHNFRVGIIRNFIGCRGCCYDLHGTTSDACPGCGKTIG